MEVFSKNNSSGKTIPWINSLKALCIFFVFLRHCENYYGTELGVFDGIYLPFYVNAFFLVSGYLLFWKQLSSPRIDDNSKKFLTGGGKVLILNILYRIIIPSIIFATIEFFPKKVIKSEAIVPADFIVETIGGCTYWFTSALVVAEFLFLLLLFSRRHSIWFYVLYSLLFTALGWYLFSSDFRFVKINGSFPWQYKHGLICMIYMAMGGLYWKYESSIHSLLKWWVVLPLSAIYIVCSIIFKDYLYSGYMTSLGFIHPLGALWSVLASILLIELCRILPPTKILTFIGQNSIGFYFMSGALPIVMSIVALRLIPGANVLTLLSVFLVCVAIALIAMFFLTRYCPWLFDLRLLRKQNKHV